MRYAISLALWLALTASAGAFDNGKADVDMPQLKEKAAEVVEVNLEGQTLEQGSRLLAIRDGITGSMKKLLGGLKGIYRRTYRFGFGGGYEPEEVDSIRRDLTQKGWSPMIDVEDRQNNATVSVYLYYQDSQVRGVTVVSADPKEVTVVNIVGDVDLEALAEFGESMGVPSMRLATSEIEKLQQKLPEKPVPPRRAEPASSK